MSERPTPESDEQEMRSGGAYGYDFARRLERERDEARAKADELYARHMRGQILCRSCDLHVIAYEELRAERDEALAALRAAHDWIAEREYGEEWPTEDMFDGSQRHILNRLSALLARVDGEG